MENGDKESNTDMSYNHSEKVTSTVFSESFKDYQYLLENTGQPKNPHHLISTAHLSVLPEHQPNLHQLGESSLSSH